MKQCLMGLRTKMENREKDNKGFTLVELIVVIVILAILAAILIPGLLKWIDEAKDKQYQLEARSIYIATQAVIAETYEGAITGGNGKELDDNGKDRVSALSSLVVSEVKYSINDKGVITEFQTTFTSSNGGGSVTMSWKTGEQWKKGNIFS